MKIQNILESYNIITESILSNLDNNYPLASSIVNGLHVTDEIDNISSIKSSLDDYRILKGVRVVNIDNFNLPNVFSDRVKKLAEQIKESKTIMPLIVVIDNEGPYILEGSHRIDALKFLGVKEFPALIVLDEPNTLNEHLTKVHGKWALVSKTTGRVLRYYHGSGKPSKEWVSKMEQQIHAFESINESTISLQDLYDEHELSNTSEQLYHWIDNDDLEREFEVKEMSSEQAKNLKTATDDMTVIDAFNKFATNQQKTLVQQKAKNYDSNRIIVIAGETVVDGNHQVIASVLSGNPLKYIDIYE